MARTEKNTGISPEKRRRMIEEAAYFRAERRGFSGGDAAEDWIAAEKEIAELLGEDTSGQKKKELDAYQRVREEVIRILRNAKRPISANTIRQSLDKAARELKGLGGYSADTVNKATDVIRREIASTVEKLGSTWGTISERSSDLFEVWRERGKDFLDQASTSASEWLEQFHPRKESHEHHAGEMTQPGTFECTSCGRQIQLEKPDYLPACPYCQHRSFRAT
jgi:RNA polymerase-binding transcription factor DksA